MKHVHSRRFFKAHIIVWAALSILILAVMGLISIEAANDVNDWNQWLKAQATPLLVWRLILYSATAYGWYRVRRHLSNEGLSTQQHQRLMYAEMAAVFAITTLELNAIGTN